MMTIDEKMRAEAILTEMDQLAEAPDNAETQARFTVLESEIETILEGTEMAESTTTAKTSHRLTSPNRIPETQYQRDRREAYFAQFEDEDRRNGARVNAVGSDYCTLHGLDRSKLSTGGFRSFGEYLSVLGSGRYDERMQAMYVAAGGSVSTQGGALVPERFIAEVLHPPGEDELILPRARKFSMNESVLHVGTMDNLSNANGTMYSGFAAEWVEEHGEFSDQTPTTSKITLTRHKLGLFTTASNELLSDSSYEQQLVPALQQALRDFRDDAFFNGNGVAKPKGILNDPAIVTVAKETNQPADTIVTENLNKMYARLHPRLVRRAR